MSLAHYLQTLREWASRLGRRGVGYWARLLITVVVVYSLVGWIDSKDYLSSYRWGFYRALQKVTPGRLIDINTVVVTIGDQEYWKGELDRRVPIKRDYLARLVDRLDAADPQVIALDFDLRSPVPDGKPREAADYVAETSTLLDTVKRVSGHRAVVLPRTVSDDATGYVLDSDIYDGFDFGKGMVSRGYIVLPYDALRVPVGVDVQGTPVDSLSVAIVRAFRPKAVDTLPKGDSLPYGSFLPAANFDHLGASDVLTEDPAKQVELRTKVSGRVVIVGGNWSSQSYGRGDPIDTHDTPIGSMTGAYIHANYVEAILNDKARPPVAEVGARAIEWLLIAAMAIAFATAQGAGSTVKFVGGSWVLLALASYFCFVNLGMVFDLFIPALSVTIHWLLEQAWEAFRSRVRGERRLV